MDNRYQETERDTGEYFGSRTCVCDMLKLGILFSLSLTTIFHLEDNDKLRLNKYENKTNLTNNSSVTNSSFTNSSFTNSSFTNSSFNLSVMDDTTSDIIFVNDDLGELDIDNVDKSSNNSLQIHNSSYTNFSLSGAISNVNSQSNNNNPQSVANKDVTSVDYVMIFVVGLFLLSSATIVIILQKKKHRNDDNSSKSRGNQDRKRKRHRQEDTDITTMVENPVAIIRRLKTKLEKATRLDRDHKYREAFDLYYECLMTLNDSPDPSYRDSYKKYRQVYIKRASDIVKMYPDLQPKLNELTESSSLTIGLTTGSVLMGKGGRGRGGRGAGRVGRGARGRGMVGIGSRGVGRGGRGRESVVERSNSHPDLSRAVSDTGLRHRNSPRNSERVDNNTRNISDSSQISITIGEKNNNYEEESSASESDGDGDCDREMSSRVFSSIPRDKDKKDVIPSRDKIKHEFKIPISS